MTVTMMVAFLADKCKSQASSFVPLPFITERKLFASREQLEAKLYINSLVAFLTVVEALFDKGGRTRVEEDKNENKL